MRINTVTAVKCPKFKTHILAMRCEICEHCIGYNAICGSVDCDYKKGDYMVTDILGREIKVGDIVCLCSRVGNHGSLKIRKVCSLTPYTLYGMDKTWVNVVALDEPSTHKGRSAIPENMLVITDIFVGCGLHD